MQYLQQRVRELESRLWQMSADRDNSTPRVLSPVDTEASIMVLPAAYRTGSPCVTEQGQTSHPDMDSEDGSHASGVDEDDGSSVAPLPGDRLRDTDDTVIKDAASILEFLAWGRRKDPAYYPSGRRASVVALPLDALESHPRGVGRPGHATLPVPRQPVTAAIGDVGRSSRGENDSLQPEAGGSMYGGSLQQQPLAVIQLLLPSRQQVEQLVHYHIECLLWYHSSFFASQFRADLADFYDKHSGSITRAGMDLQWVALLFSVLAGSLTCAPDPQALAWGFSEPERHALCKHWFQASLECLNRDQYMANHSIYSCQTIATMTISAHILGFSNTQSIQLAAAVRIAQSLGLHQLGMRGAEPPDAEMGRRVWSQLCTQDWFSIPFSETYLVNPLHSQSCTLLNCHDDDLATPLPEHEPTVSGYSRFLNTIASIMPSLQDGLLSCNTAYTRYQQVLAWDAHMRTLAMAKRPQFLSGQIALQPHWPSWIPWARRALAISSGHKIIMIHRSFLSESFTNPAFSFTRHTCIAASKTIIKEYKAAQREDGPTLWVHQAFSIAASIILLLDVLHWPPGEHPERVAHKQLVEDVVSILKKSPNSMIAVRGIKLLRALLDELATQQGHATSRPTRKRKRHPSSHNAEDPAAASPQGTSFNVPEFIRRYCQNESAAGQRQKRTSETTHQQHQASDEAEQSQPGGSQDGVAGGDGLVRSSVAHEDSDPEPISAGLTTPSGHADTGGAEPDQLETSRLLPLGWDSSSNGFENLLYLVNHDLVLP